jgi:hypothetical protein
MSFNIFGPATKNDVRVGYISTERGFVDGVTVAQANDYARRNPGTQFIFRTRDEIKYLNINEVNNLNPDDLLPQSSKDCPGIELESDCGPTKVYFYGGGGIGAKGNPIIGEDGSLLAVDLVSGGFGYQYPPITQVKDNCGIGAGTVVRSVLGEIVETVEFYDQEDDFEEYDISPLTDAGFGRVYSPDGNDVGEWDPTLYANFSKDPIRREIQEYQKFLESLRGGTRVSTAENIIRCWWSTRTETPLAVTSLTRTSRVKHDVTFFSWGDFMNSHAISPTPPSNVPGTDYAGITFTFEWEKEFPYEGEYVFKAMADNIAKIFLDNQLLFQTSKFGDEPPDKIKKVVNEGVHRIRVDLYNIPFLEKVITQESKTGRVNVDFSVYGEGKSTRGFSFFFTAEDGSDSFTIRGVSRGKETRKDTISVKPNIKYKVVATSTRGNVEQGLIQNKKNKEGGVGTSNKIFADYIASANDNDDIQITAGSGTFTSSNKRKAKGSNRSTYDLSFLVSEKDNSSKSSTQSQQVRRVFNTVDYITKADRKLWRTNVYSRGGFLNEYGVCPFDTTVQLQDNPYAGTHRIVWDNVDFPIDGNYVIELDVDDNVNLTFQGPGTEVTISKRGFTSTGQKNEKSIETRAFNRGKYKIIADLEQNPDGQFGFIDMKGINPMALSINIETSFTEQEVISKRSWIQNPMGISMCIDAPLPPIPQEPVIEQEGRCPRNPIWSTRSPGSNEKWYPVRFGEAWSKFMNRYAISPVLPLSQKGSDGGGVVYKNSWNLDIPYDGFYALRGTVDNGGRILIDGKEIARGGGVSFRGRTVGKKGLDGFRVENPQTTKVFLTKGMHTIDVEVENEKTETFERVDKKVLDTGDWLPATPIAQKVDVKFNISSGADFSNSISIPDLDINLSKTYKGNQINEKLKRSVEIGKVYTVTIKSPESKRGLRLRSRDSVLEAEESTDNDWTDIICAASRGRFFDFKDGKNEATCKYTIDSVRNTGPLVKDGVTYNGPVLASYRNGTLGPFLTPAFNGDEDYRANNMDRTWILTWDNVDFPVDGQYTLRAEADDYVIVRVDGVEVGVAKVFEGVRTFNFNVSRGKRKVEMEIYNIPGNNRSTFDTNPIVFNAIITVPISQPTGLSKPWTTNPVGISAILVPPPCPKIIRGKGVVTEVIVDDPGNGNPSLPNNVPPADASAITYPVTLRLKSVVVENPGINHNCGVDEIQITPSNGAVLSYDCDSFGRIRSVNVLDPGLGFTSYPDISMVTDTGINARFRPQFEVVRDPIVADPAKLIQVTDLVGLKQTGYVDGRAYFGAVFYKDGVRYAGFYETPGELVQVYDTLQESIDAQVVTRPSAILRQGTDTNSNNPRLNLPGTPDTLI